ncbi:zinc-binding alcohol dehydrogenase family protein [Magnetospirillum aberrantis]|uniref:Zinc-type alcohol dehydrogenase-like protein n=1 Tax=Magnetospirillum aberrantis SpK TaxID=908842 RepID=A0A7C9V145_9PROT|nr:zinc-binding alcohol dehydrogenase family protein [Magnetospirillum aberrantis]NFV81451.1 zinc-binding alcohol dehydrogenase family protein [Magnetospirillum aberrantis SpK]
MRAVAYRRSLPITDSKALEDVDLPRPVPSGRDLLVEIRAVSVNPVDTKIRHRVDPAGEPKVLGWDAAGVVVATGPDATLFKPGDAVFHAGDLSRPGTNAQFHLVDERIVGPKPASLDFAAAAALPLTAITAWELLFDRLEIKRGAGADSRILLIVGGAGGVGSIAIQLARHLTGLTVIATASRPETKQWCADLGAHHVLDHSRPLAPQVAALGLGAPQLVVSLTATDQHQADIADLIAPQGRFGLIDDPAAFNLGLFKRKSVSVHWEFMFTRSLFATPDVIAQHHLLAEVSRLVDQGVLRTTLSETMGAINAANLIKAHALIESGKAKGKVVLEGF